MKSVEIYRNMVYIYHMDKSKAKLKTLKDLKRRVLIPDYDTAWKEILEKHFEQVLEFLFPEIYIDIDFSKGVEILSNELRRIIPRGKIGKRHVDVLVKVHLKKGHPSTYCVFIHVEVQGNGQVFFMTRVFEYYYRIFEKYIAKGVEIVTLAILTDDDPDYRPKPYHLCMWGFEHKLQIPMVKVIDFRDKPELIKKLETSTNPMALIIKVQLKSMEVKKEDSSKKFDIKRELIRELYTKGYDKAYIRSLFIFIDLIFPLSDDLEKVVTEDINKYEEVTHMELPLLSIERVALLNAKEEGLKQGEKQGVKKGVKQGVKQGEIQALREVAANLFKEGMTFESIRKCVRLPEKDIRKIIATVQ